MRIVVPIGAGSSMDIVCRVLAQKLTEAWNQTVIVDNRAGAGGNFGADLVAKSAADGYNILFASSSFSIAPSFYKKLSYDYSRRAARRGRSSKKSPPSRFASCRRPTCESAGAQSRQSPA